MSALEAVIFDWGGTLTPWHTVDPAQAWAAATPNTDAVARLVAAENAAWATARDTQVSAQLADILGAAEVDADEAMIGRFHAWWEPHTYLDPDVPALFAELHARGLKIGVLSNTVWPRAEHERIFARDGVLDQVDGAVYTSEIPWTKPHPEAFRAALAAVGVADPARAVFVGDRPFDDIHGARSVGMRAVLLPHSTIPDWQRGHTEGEPDATLDRLADLVAIIDRWLE